MWVQRGGWGARECNVNAVGRRASVVEVTTIVQRVEVLGVLTARTVVQVVVNACVHSVGYASPAVRALWVSACGGSDDDSDKWLALHRFLADGSYGTTITLPTTLLYLLIAGDTASRIALLSSIYQHRPTQLTYANSKTPLSFLFHTLREADPPEEISVDTLLPMHPNLIDTSATHAERSADSALQVPVVLRGMLLSGGVGGWLAGWFSYIAAEALFLYTLMEAAAGVRMQEVEYVTALLFCAVQCEHSHEVRIAALRALESILRQAASSRGGGVLSTIAAFLLDRLVMPRGGLDVLFVLRVKTQTPNACRMSAPLRTEIATIRHCLYHASILQTLRVFIEEEVMVRFSAPGVVHSIVTDLFAEYRKHAGGGGGGGGPHNFLSRLPECSQMELAFLLVKFVLHHTSEVVETLGTHKQTAMYESSSVVESSQRPPRDKLLTLVLSLCLAQTGVFLKGSTEGGMTPLLLIFLQHLEWCLHRAANCPHATIFADAAGAVLPNALLSTNVVCVGDVRYGRGFLAKYCYLMFRLAHFCASRAADSTDTLTHNEAYFAESMMNLYLSLLLCNWRTDRDAYLTLASAAMLRVIHEDEGVQYRLSALLFDKLTCVYCARLGDSLEDVRNTDVQALAMLYEATRRFTPTDTPDEGSNAAAVLILEVLWAIATKVPILHYHASHSFALVAESMARDMQRRETFAEAFTSLIQGALKNTYFCKEDVCTVSASASASHGAKGKHCDPLSSGGLYDMYATFGSAQSYEDLRVELDTVRLQHDLLRSLLSTMLRLEVEETEPNKFVRKVLLRSLEVATKEHFKPKKEVPRKESLKGKKRREASKAQPLQGKKASGFNNLLTRTTERCMRDLLASCGCSLLGLPTPVSPTMALLSPFTPKDPLSNPLRNRDTPTDHRPQVTFEAARQILVFFGPPSSGKGTQGVRLAKKTGLPQLSTGDILRDEVKRGTEVGMRAEKVMQSGELVQDSLVMEIVASRIEQPDCQRGFILDGFPRTQKQAEMLDDLLDSKGEGVRKVLYLDVSDSLLEERVCGRWIHKPSGRSYHTKFCPPKSLAGREPSVETMLDDETGEALMQRSDDTADALKSRLEAYHTETTPVLQYYGELVQKVDGEQESDLVWHDIQVLMGMLDEGVVSTPATPHRDTGDVANREILVFFGPPSSGKGTQGVRLAQKTGLPQLSTGDILRDEVKRGTEVGKRAEKVMQSGELVQDSLVMEIVASRIEQPDCQRGFILDGFPRTQKQAEMLDDLLDSKGEGVRKVLYLDVSDSLLEERVCGRWIHKPSGRSYHTKFCPPKSLAGREPSVETMLDDETGEALMQRSDDTADALKSRLEAYHTETTPVLQYYCELVKTVDGEQDTETVWHDIQVLMGMLDEDAVATPHGDVPNREILVFFGPPSSGKGTQGVRLAQKTGLPQLSTGDILRDEVKRGTEVGKRAEKVMQAGELVQDSLVMEIVASRIEQPDCQRGFILDGFPRTQKQAEMLDDLLDSKGEGVRKVLYLDVSDSLLEERVCGRWIHKPSGRSYHTKFCPPKSLAGREPSVETMLDDETGEALMQRSDDTADALKSRLEAYHTETTPVLQHYCELVKTVDGEQESDLVWHDIQVLMGMLDEVAKPDTTDEPFAASEEAPAQAPEGIATMIEEGSNMPALRALRASLAEIKREILVFFGAPGSGKGTQGVRLAKKTGLPQLSTGDMLRDEVKRGTPVGKRAEKVMQSGELVQDSLVAEIVTSRIEQPDCQRGFILDGFPRTQKQAEMLDDLLDSKGEGVRKVLYLDVSDSLLEERVCGRWIHKPSGRSYHTKFCPPKSLAGREPSVETMLDDETGEALMQRSDDTADALKSRLEAYHTETTPVLQYYGELVQKVDGEQDTETVWHDIQVVMRMTAQQSGTAVPKAETHEEETAETFAPQVVASLQQASEDAVNPDTTDEPFAASEEPPAQAPEGIATMIEEGSNMPALRALRASLAEIRREILVFFGAPGSGKGTQGVRLAKKTGLPQLSTGDMLRDEVKRGTPVGKRAEKVMQAGELVQDSLVAEIVTSRIEQPDCQRGFILDGFPRTQKQAEMLDDLLDSKGEGVRKVLYLDVSDSLLEERVCGRWIHKPSGRSYHTKFCPPKSLAGREPSVETMLDDETGEALMQRSDDTADALKSRLEAYHTETTPVLQYYGELVQKVDGEQDTETVWHDIQVVMGMTTQQSSTAVPSTETHEEKTADASPQQTPEDAVNPDEPFAASEEAPAHAPEGIATMIEEGSNMPALRALRASLAEIKREILVFFGAPGSGKGTQGVRLAKKTGLPQLSTGDMLRDEVKRGTPVGKRAEKVMQAGELVQDSLVAEIVTSRIEQRDCQRGFILDGFPRTQKQAEMLDDLLDSKGEGVRKVLYLDVSDSLLEERVCGRWIHKPSGRSYHAKFCPPKSLAGREPSVETMLDDETGEALMQRSDDTADALKSRLEAYHTETTPVLQYYGELVQKVDGEQDTETVWHDIQVVMRMTAQSGTAVPSTETHEEETADASPQQNPEESVNPDEPFAASEEPPAQAPEGIATMIEEGSNMPALRALRASLAEIKREILVFFGAPGSGKGTQGVRLAKKTGLPQLSTGDMLRDEVKRGTPVGKRAEKVMQAGELVQDSLVAEIVTSRIEQPDCQRGFILDGFPRTQKQAEMLDDLLDSKGEGVRKVLYLDVSDSLLEERVCGRWIHKPSGRSYHTKFCPPKSLAGREPSVETMLDDETGEALMQRSDDTADALKSRLEAYHTETTPVLQYYGELVQKVDGEQDTETVWHDIQVLMDG